MILRATTTDSAYQWDSLSEVKSVTTPINQNTRAQESAATMLLKSCCPLGCTRVERRSGLPGPSARYKSRIPTRNPPPEKAKQMAPTIQREEKWFGADRDTTEPGSPD